jgi:hypothetical protein
MTSDDNRCAASVLTLADRLHYLDDLEREFTRAGSAIMARGATLGHADFFLFGAMKRTLAQSRGFRILIEARNFPCAAAILRLQIDTAMRVNALSLVDDADALARAILDGEQFNRLTDRDRQKMTDAYLRRRLAHEHAWIGPVYERTSGFIHLSGNHFDVAIASTDEDSRVARFQISAEDPARPEEAYFEVVDSFVRATKLAGSLVVACLSARHPSVAP